MKIEIELKHDEQALTLSAANDLIDFSLSDSKKLSALLMKKIKELEKRKNPPCVPPFYWEKEPFAETHSCSSSKTNGMCSGFVGNKEFYPGDMVNLRDWLNKAIEYHRKNNCKDLERAGTK